MVKFAISVKSFIVDKNNRLLVLKREAKDPEKPGIWEIPGGRLDLGENPVLGLKRETKEETGLDIDVLNPLGVRHFTRDDGQKITMIIFLCRAKRDPVIISEEHTNYEWIDLYEEDLKLTDFFDEEVDVYKKRFMK